MPQMLCVCKITDNLRVGDGDCPIENDDATARSIGEVARQGAVGQQQRAVHMTNTATVRVVPMTILYGQVINSHVAVINIKSAIAFVTVERKPVAVNMQGNAV